MRVTSPSHRRIFVGQDCECRKKHFLPFPPAAFEKRMAELYRGQVTHMRWSPKRHGFAYELAMLMVDVDVSREQPHNSPSACDIIRFSRCGARLSCRSPALSRALT